MLLFAPQVDDMADALKEWGIEVSTDAVAVHEPSSIGDGRQGDVIEEAQRYPFIFDIRDYGDHVITKPLRSLAVVPRPDDAGEDRDDAAEGVKITPIIPIPTEPKSWGETDIEGAEATAATTPRSSTPASRRRGRRSSAARSRRRTNGGARLVVIASPMFAFDRYLNEPDPNMLRRGVIVSRFPANAELFNNASSGWRRWNR